MNKQRRENNISVSFLALISTLIFTSPSIAENNVQMENGGKPERLIVMAVEYPGVVISRNENVRMDVIFKNKGQSDETVHVRIAQKPRGWKVRIKTFLYDVTAIAVPSNEAKTLTFEAIPGKNIKPGNYEFRVEAETPDGYFKASQNIVVDIKEEASSDGKGVKIVTSYPVLQGPSDGTFEFSLDVVSKLEKDAVFDLFAQGPKGWVINFKPAYEKKYISSIRLKTNQTTTVAVEAKPPPMSKAGKYPFSIRVSSDDAETEAKLTVILTGTYQLEVGTSTGLLSLDAGQGKPANMSIYVKNTGSAVNNNIKFMSLKPENWKVVFSPNTIPTIQPGELKQVEVTITPYDEALVGDYSISARVEGEQAAKTMEFRVTVKASSTWGWIGIGIIVMVIFGLTVLFRKFGRR